MGGVGIERLHRDIGLIVSYCVDIKSVKENTSERIHKFNCTYGRISWHAHYRELVDDKGYFSSLIANPQPIPAQLFNGFNIAP